MTHPDATDWAWDPDEQIPPPCLQFEEFVDALAHAYRVGAQGSLEAHVLPQHYFCPAYHVADGPGYVRASACFKRGEETKKWPSPPRY